MPITVLVADDHAIVREGLATLLASQPDIEVIGTAASGREALVQVLLLKPQVAILDISMPELNGIEATRQIIEKIPDMNIVVLSMHSSAG